MNILILSCGTRNKLVQYFKEEFKNIGNIIATDTSKLAPALYDADRYYIVPEIKDENYLDTILSICKKEKINLVLTLIDPEISLIAKNRKLFQDINCDVLVSSKELVDLSFDKFKMFEYLVAKGIDTPKTYSSRKSFDEDFLNQKISFPVFVKPREGSASLGISLIESKEKLSSVFSNDHSIIVQEYMDCIEYGVDVYIDLISGELISYFIKKKIKMRSGETDKSVSIKNSKLENLIVNFINKTDFRGVIDIDIFEKNNKFYISEVNPRFGGGYPHAHESGVNFLRYIRNNLNGKKNTPQLGNYEKDIYMMKYNEVSILKKM